MRHGDVLLLPGVFASWESIGASLSQLEPSAGTRAEESSGWPPTVEFARHDMHDTSQRRTCGLHGLSFRCLQHDNFKALLKSHALTITFPGSALEA